MKFSTEKTVTYNLHIYEYLPIPKLLINYGKKYVLKSSFKPNKKQLQILVIA